MMYGCTNGMYSYSSRTVMYCYATTATGKAGNFNSQTKEKRKKQHKLESSSDSAWMNGAER